MYCKLYFKAKSKFYLVSTGKFRINFLETGNLKFTLMEVNLNIWIRR